MSETIIIRPSSHTTPTTGTHSNIAKMYDGDETTSGYLTTSVTITGGTTTVSQSCITNLEFDLSAIPANAVVTKLELYSRGQFTGQGTVSGVSTTRYYDFGFCDATTLIGNGVTYPSSIATKSASLTNETQISNFLNSTHPRARVRSNTIAKRKSGSASGTLTTMVRVYDTYLVVTYELPTSAKAKVKVNGAWEDGTIKVKANDTWVGAKKIYAKVNGSWEEV